MYTKISTEECIDRLWDFLKLPAMTEFYGTCPKAMIKAIKLVPTNKRMRFRDFIIRQISRIAMGMLQKELKRAAKELQSARKSQKEPTIAKKKPRQKKQNKQK
jgi:hypothetical protein